MKYGPREHVDFVSQLLTGVSGNSQFVGQEKQWKSPNIQRMAGAEMGRAALQGLIKLYDVSPLQPLLLWEVSVLREAAAKQSAQHLPTGRWGEQLVALYLRLTLAGRAEVTWVNDAQETGLPYDVLVKHADGTLQYIEVKSSAQEQLHIFYITPRELDAAAKFRGQYSIVRVFGCPEAYCRPAVPVDCAAALLAGKLPGRPLSKKQLANEKQQGRLSARELARQQAAQQQGRMGHTRLLFLQDPVELMRRKLVKLALEV